MQIVIQTDKININKHLEMMEAFKKEEVYLAEMVEDYIHFIKMITKQKESISRRFYVIIDKEASEEKLFSYFDMVGNTITKCSESEIKEILRRFFRRASGVRKETKWV